MAFRKAYQFSTDRSDLPLRILLVPDGYVKSQAREDGQNIAPQEASL